MCVVCGNVGMWEWGAMCEQDACFGRDGGGGSEASEAEDDQIRFARNEYIGKATRTGLMVVDLSWISTPFERIPLQLGSCLFHPRIWSAYMW